MKSFAILFATSVALSSQATIADSSCEESRYDFPKRGIVYSRNKEWLVSIGSTVLVVKDDAISMKIVSPEPLLHLSCGYQNRVIALSRGSVPYEYADGALKEIKIKFPGRLYHTDGQTTYSADEDVEHCRTTGYYNYYATKDGVSTEIAHRADMSARAYESQFYVFFEDRFEIFKNGVVTSKVVRPQGAFRSAGKGFGGFLECGNGAYSMYFDRDKNLIFNSPYGIGRAKIKNATFDVEASDNCSEYVVRTADRTTNVGGLASVVPGKISNLRYLKTPCSVESFSLNKDGSAFYRCGRDFYYSEPKFKRAVLVGRTKFPVLAENASNGGKPIEWWLPTSDYGTLYSAIEGVDVRDGLKACFARLLPDRFVPIGCVDVDSVTNLDRSGSAPQMDNPECKETSGTQPAR